MEQKKQEFRKLEKKQTGNHKQKETLLKTSDGIKRFRALLKEAEFNPREPKLAGAWEAYKKFSEISFDCAIDNLLFEAGIYDCTEGDVFCLSLVRQFTLEVEDEYDYIEQIHLDLLYQPDETLRGLKETLLTYEFDDNVAAFLEAVEKSPAFQIPLKQYAPAAAEIYQDEI